MGSLSFHLSTTWVHHWNEALCFFLGLDCSFYFLRTALLLYQAPPLGRQVTAISHRTIFGCDLVTVVDLPWITVDLPWLVRPLPRLSGSLYHFLFWRAWHVSHPDLPLDPSTLHLGLTTGLGPTLIHFILLLHGTSRFFLSPSGLPPQLPPGQSVCREW